MLLSGSTEIRAPWASLGWWLCFIFCVYLTKEHFICLLIVSLCGSVLGFLGLFFLSETESHNLFLHIVTEKPVY